MSGNLMIKIMRTTVFALGLFASAVCCAHGGGHGGGGGWHGGGGGWHGGGFHGRGFHGGWHGGGWGWWGPGVVIGVPFDDYYYGGPACQPVRVCNNYGHCWLQESCY